jgi:hypothetical protein
MADDRAKPRAGFPDVAGLAVAGIAVISAVTGIVGGLTGGVARVARNTWWVLPLATLLVFVAVGLALAASPDIRLPVRRPDRPANHDPAVDPAPPSEPAHPPSAARAPVLRGLCSALLRLLLRLAGLKDLPVGTLPSRPANTSTTAPQGTEAAPPQPSGWLLLASLIAFGSAATLVAWGLSNSLHTPDRPIVSAKWTPVSGRWVLSGTARASDLSTKSQLTIVVSRLVDNGDSAPPSARPTAASTAPWWTPPPHQVYTSGVVYLQTVGADINGNATITFEVPLPDGYDGLQVIATLETRFVFCPTPPPPPPFNPTATATPTQSVPTLKIACLTLDAPHALPSSTPSSTPGSTPSSTASATPKA